jgi:drug/metabolite transporter, DME family
VIAGGLSWLVLKEKPGRRWLAATAIAILGCALLALPGAQIELRSWGILFALGAGTCYAVYALISKQLMKTHPPDAVMAVLVSLGAILLIPSIFWVDLSWLSEPRGLVVALYLGLVTNALANLLFGRGFKRVPTANAVTLTLAEPLTAGLLGVFLLGEVLAPISWVGIVLLVVGLVIISY